MNQLTTLLDDPEFRWLPSREEIEAATTREAPQADRKSDKAITSDEN